MQMYVLVIGLFQLCPINFGSFNIDLHAFGMSSVGFGAAWHHGLHVEVVPTLAIPCGLLTMYC